MQKKKIARWLGPAHNAGQGLCYHVVASSGEVYTRSTVILFSDDDNIDSDILEMKTDFIEKTKGNIGNYSKAVVKDSSFNDDKLYDDLFFPAPYDMPNITIETQNIDDNDTPIIRPDMDDIHDEPYAETDDKYIGQTLQLPLNGEMAYAKVLRRKRRSDGTLVGTEHNVPILDTRIYEIEHADGSISEYNTNTLLENLYNQVDEDGNQFNLLDSIIDHRKTEQAISQDDGYIISHNGVKRKVITTKGWEMNVRWKEGSESWIPMNEIKESNPLELAEYAVSHKIQHEPAFSWWVHTILNKRNRIIHKVKTRTKIKNMKYGIKIPMSITEAKKLDHENGNDLWNRAIVKETNAVRVAFQLLNEGDKPPIGSKSIQYHWIFTIKFDLSRKARLVAGGHMNKDVPTHTTFSSVVSRESVRLSLLIAAINGLDLLMGDISNAYLHAAPREKVHVEIGPELFGESCEGRTALIIKALYGLKSSGAAWRHHFSSYLRDHLRFKATTADPDVYIKKTSDSDGKLYYTYLLVYVDDILVINKNPKEILDEIKRTFTIKSDSIKYPDVYLGMDITNRIHKDNGHSYMITGSNTYTKRAVSTVKDKMKKDGITFNSNPKQPFSNVSYRAELDSSPFCDTQTSVYYMQLIGTLRWMCGLGRIDILYETSILSRYSIQPRTGHFQQLLHIFHYLDKHSISWLPIDTHKLNIDWNGENGSSPWERAKFLKEIYPDAIEETSHDAPIPLGSSVQINTFVDADHAGDKLSRRSQTGILIFCNMTLINWSSKK